MQVLLMLGTEWDDINPCLGQSDELAWYVEKQAMNFTLPQLVALMIEQHFFLPIVVSRNIDKHDVVSIDVDGFKPNH